MLKPYNLLDLFSGIGGFSLGLERSGGFKTAAFCEIEKFPRRVLQKHWPEVPIYDDVRTLTADRLIRDGISIDAICGGFPCQDISLAGKGAGLAGARSGLWSEFFRLIGELRPQYVIVENVAALLGRGIDRVLGDMASIGYDAEWHCIPARDVGAPHRRDRVWIIAYPQKKRPVSVMEGILQGSRSWKFRRSLGRYGVYGVDSPAVCRVDDGFSPRVDRHYALGNAVVPQIPEMIGGAIMEFEATRRY